MSDIPLWVQLIIGIFGSGTVGAIAGAISSSTSSRHRLRELEISYRQKLDENYLINARSHIDTIYIPFNAILTKLEKDHDRFARKCYINKNDALDETDVKEFKDACNVYLQEVSNLFSDGKDVYLTGELSRWFGEFNNFLEISLITKEITFFQDTLPLDQQLILFPLMMALVVPFLNSKKRSIIEEEAKHALSAPIETVVFSKSFRRYISNIKALIREVTLGVKEVSIR